MLLALGAIQTTVDKSKIDDIARLRINISENGIFSVLFQSIVKIFCADTSLTLYCLY